MPHIAIQLSGPRNTERQQKISQAIAQLTQDILGKRPEVIAITFSQVAAQDWWIAGQTLEELGQSAFQLDISITDETNTKAEKARYLQAVYDTIAGLMPHLHPVSYVHVIDARAAAYGYGGKTQEYRYHHS
ncbi:tautomerase family protein [Comamonas piscis]|uniref:Tautomerase family protein n=1 Tax=Comamonas piscis TaxID=1562974 RepID=A0A7G5EM94_9BURK|nr:tautomerase family protein [Comamonas piscis]QMV75119.1 tautomerase family protein [Comamonas piscis]WSO33604.1 tautomerase family protein [Comamonas piscis]